MRDFECKFEAIGTQWKIAFQSQALEIIETLVRQRIKEFDKNYSRFRPDSRVSQWSKKAGEYNLPEDGQELFDFYKRLYDASDGLVTPLIGKTLEDAGYDADYSLKPKQVTSPPRWEDVLDFPGTGPGSKIVIKQPVLFDFGAAGKGYLVDVVARLLQENGVSSFSINAGGDIYTYGLEQTIGLEDPDDTSQVLGFTKINNGAIASSSGNRRKWGKYHHILNPKTLESPKNIKAVWVKAATTMLTDGVATALFFVQPEILKQTFEFEYVIIEDDDLKYSSDFNVEFFKK